MNDIAAAFTAATGTEFTYVRETVDEAYASRRGSGAPDWQLEAWVTTYLQIAAGEIDIITDSAERLTGHPPNNAGRVPGQSPRKAAGIVAALAIALTMFTRAVG